MLKKKNRSTVDNIDYTQAPTEDHELLELSKQSSENGDDSEFGLRNRSSIGEVGDDEFLLSESKLSLPSVQEDSPIPLVSAAVSLKDDPSLPCLTFRFWILSTLFTVLGAAVSEFYYFRSNGGGYSIFFVLLVSYVFGNWMAKYLPNDEIKFYKWRLTLNSGPFNIKEHVLIAVAAGAGGGSAYGTDIIAIQELFYNQHSGFVIGMLLLLSTQMIGFGLAGFLRKYLVRPANMLWPSNLVFSSLFSTLHGNVSDTNDKLKFFTFSFISVFIWQFFPQFICTWLTSMALLCLIKPFDKNIVRLGSGYNGLGILNISLDWNAIGQQDKNGERYNQTAIIDSNTGMLNETAYQEYGPVYLSVTFAIGYFYSFISFTAAITHVILFYGDEIWARFKASRSEEVEDIHCKMMKNYEGCTNYNLSMILCYVAEAHLPWWGLLLSVGLAITMVLPIGIIQAVSNNQVANVYFKCYGYMAMHQCLAFVSDLKLGHYMKIPPKAMFTAQLWGTVVGAFINYWLLQLIIWAKRPYLDGTIKDPTGQWTGFRSQVFNTASIIWGLIGPGRTFGPVRFISPFPFYFLHKKYPKARFNLVTIPLICKGLSLLPGTYTNFLISGFIASFLTACDSASQIVTMVIFFCFNGLFSVNWWGNNYETQGERCFEPKT
ncbi:1785_t:CDS:10 [Diversispora eburnea]|uniref:1785_t:CDS:1 n=1 Tax=Diversispora eburnea TaxID=1213867 RepID=A0A9N8V0P3_9GLOM|nr:1785_t:CDS:10 [Diversispora eburnea]